MSPNRAQELFMGIYCECTVSQLVDNSEWHTPTAAQLCDFNVHLNKI